MIEPVIGQRVRFKDRGSLREGVVTDVFIAGRPGGTGLKRERRRVRIAFCDGDKAFDTHRDLNEIEIDEQPALF